MTEQSGPRGPVSMRVLVVNAGSSTVKLALMEAADGTTRQIQRVQREWDGGAEAADVLADGLRELEGPPEAIGYRVVHGGDEFSAPTVVTAEVEAGLEALIPLAPLHNAPALAAIRAVQAHYPQLPGVAVFDTAFHRGRPAWSMSYALPEELVRGFGLRRYGFHGIAHASLVEQLATALGTPVGDVSAVTLQLGAGCSACAVQQGRSIDTSMGFTPLEGLVMATRSGDIDPAIVVRLIRAGYDADHIEALLTRRSGLLALSGKADMREILAAEASGDQAAARALELFCQRIVLTVGGYLTLLRGAGALVFGGGIGTHAAEIRRRVAAGLEAWGVAVDPELNRQNRPGCISAAGSRPVFVLETDEEAVIARQVAAHLGAAR